MQAYILTGTGRRVTATEAPLFRDDILFEILGDGTHRKYRAAGAERLIWVRV